VKQNGYRVAIQGTNALDLHIRLYIIHFAILPSKLALKSEENWRGDVGRQAVMSIHKKTTLPDFFDWKKLPCCGL